MSAKESWVEVRESDPAWAQLYKREASTIKRALGDYAVGIEHFGSTSVPGLAAKPIVDILVGASENSVTGPVLASFELLGYEFLGEEGRRPGRYFFRKRGEQAFNVSIVPMNGSMWADNLRLRDF